MKIVILEDNKDRQAAMQALLAERFGQYQTHFFDDSREMIEFLNENLSDVILVCLDHDLELKPDGSGRWLDPGTGRDVADYLARKPAACPVVIHTTNSPAGQIILPSGLLRTNPGQEDRTFRVAPARDPGNDWFRTAGRAIMGFGTTSTRRLEIVHNTPASPPDLHKRSSRNRP